MSLKVRAARRPFVKVCGLTRPGDAALAVALGATHIGAVRTRSSPRSIEPEGARDVFAAATGSAATVYVFKDVPVASALRDARAAGVTTMQLYGATDEDVRRCLSEGFRVLRVYGMEAGDEQLPELDPLPSDNVLALFDVGGGGSGRRFEWSLLGSRAPEKTFIAGGIRPDNVRELLRYEPYGIDLSSGVEASPGVKDEAKLRALFEEVF